MSRFSVLAADRNLLSCSTDRRVNAKNLRNAGFSMGCDSQIGLKPAFYR